MFYQSIANVYDYIFPQNPKQLELIQQIKTIDEKESIIDVGCATGNLTELLSRHAGKVYGIDLDQAILDHGRSKFGQLQLEALNMLDLEKKFEGKEIHRIVSFGNTLVHLPTREMVDQFFSTAYNTLKPGGLFVVQIINYDRIIDQHISSLPTIDNEHINFIRDYSYDAEHGTVDFITNLTIKESKQVINNTITLLALREKTLLMKLEQAGFENILFYGDLAGGPITPNAIPLIFSCTKPLV